MLQLQHIMYQQAVSDPNLCSPEPPSHKSDECEGDPDSVVLTYGRTSQLVMNRRAGSPGTRSVKRILPIGLVTERGVDPD